MGLSLSLISHNQYDTVVKNFLQEYDGMRTLEIPEGCSFSDPPRIMQSLDEGIITSPYFPRWGAIDPAFGSSDFGIIVVQWRDNKLECVFCDSITKPCILIC